MASMSSDDYPSDTDLLCGLPSPDTSDDEDIKECQDLGIVVPHFCNKLRTLTQPLFPNTEPIILSDLFDEGNAPEKAESRKKSSKEDADVSGKSMTRSGGYVSGPRSTKSPSTMRSYDPCDITGDDEFEIAGVIFRTSFSAKDKRCHSSRDSDFPSLNESSQSDISELSKSNDTSLGPLGSLIHESKMAYSPCVQKAGVSPITSTPHPKNRSVLQQESPLSISQRQPRTSPFNTEPLCCDYASKLEPKSNSRSGSKNNRRRSKRLSQNPSDGGNSPSLDSPICDFNANNFMHHPGCTDGFKCELCLEVESKIVDTNKRPVSQSQTNSSNHIATVGMDKMSSPVLYGLCKKSDTSNDRLDTRCNQSANKSSPTWSNIVKTSPHLSPVMRIDSPTNYTQDFHPLSGRNEPKPVEIVRKVAFNNRKNLCTDDGEPAPISSRKSNGGKKHRVQLTSVDSCVTPSKESDGNWPSSNGADVLAFENRFVEKIAVDGTSPPKKVNPLPIKKLDFSKRTRDNALSTGSGKESRGGLKNEPLCRRQVSIISDLDWKKSTPNEQSKRNSRGNSSGNKEKNARGRRSMFSLEDYMKTKESVKVKDELHKEEVDDEREAGNSETKTKVDAFWVTKRVAGADELKTCRLGSGHKSVIEDVKQVASTKLVESNQDVGVDDFAGRPDQNVADVKQVTLKAHLIKYARRYCHFVEGHYVTNISREVLFILQILTCSDLNSQIVRELDLKTGHAVFGSIHNCVYFAVVVIKRLKRLFSCLPQTTLCLLTSNPRIEAFSPKLYNFLKACLVGKIHGTNEDMLSGNPQDFSLLGSSHLWSSSFSDTKMAHIFKCQRDNFFALYQRYHDSTEDHPFQMGEQIHYVYDPQISEHNSVVNLMHLAQLFLDHLLQSSFKHSSNQVNYLEMVLGRETNSSLFKKKFDKWKQSNSSLKFGSPPLWDQNELFFKDFIDAMRCPSFNELMKNIIVSKIMELNGTDFGYLKNLHSSVCLPDDQTPQRCEKFTTTVRCLCILGKMLGYLVFAPYSGGEDLSAEEIHQIVTVRDMAPLPLPLSMMLKRACEDGHLSLTVPWVVQYLSMMDAMAPKLAAYSQLISRLSSIHRHSWKHLFCKGHHNTGLLLTSCTSWLFENPALPQGLICPRLCQSEDVFPTQQPPQTCLDTQRVVTSHLLYACCPYLNAGHIPLVMFALNHKAVSGMRRMMPLMPEYITTYQAGDGDVEELCQRLGFSLQSQPSDGISERTEIKGDQHYVKQPSVSIAMFHNARNPLGELASNFMKGHPYLSNCIHRTVELMCGKVQDYALNTILKLGIFEARVKVRRKFLKMDSGEDGDDVKNRILANSNIIARKFSSAAKQAFFQTGERVCQVELSNLINFLASHVEESARTTAIDIAQRSVMSQLVEWAELQLEDGVFHRAVVGEAEKVASSWHFKPCGLYPSDYLRKPEYSAACLEMSSGFENLQQLSKVLDTALACGGWYMNGQTRGPRPDDVFIQSLMDDFMTCINNHNVSMDFSFSIMINFFMHLTIQYITDAPQNWTNGCLETFISLCILYETKKREDDRLSFQPIESSHKSEKIKIKVTNLMSVYSLGWLSRAQELDHSLMVYCHTVVRLVESGLVTVEKVMERLISTRVNHHLTTATKFMIDRIMVKVLELLFTSGSDGTRFSTERIVSVVFMIGQRLAEWDSCKAVTELHHTFADVLAGTINHL